MMLSGSDSLWSLRANSSWIRGGASCRRKSERSKEPSFTSACGSFLQTALQKKNSRHLGMILTMMMRQIQSHCNQTNQHLQISLSLQPKAFSWSAWKLILIGRLLMYVVCMCISAGMICSEYVFYVCYAFFSFFVQCML